MNNYISKPQVSVIMPCFNTAAYIADAIESVLAQTFQCFELLIIDDGSTDSTESIVADYLADARIHYLKQANQGPSVSRNIGIKMARGQYVAFLDADDVWDSEKLSCQLDYLAAHSEVGLLFSNFSTFDANGVISGRKLPDLLPERISYSFLFSRNNFIWPSTVLVKKAVFADSGLFDTEIRCAEDYDLWLRILQVSTVAYLSESQANIRQHANNATMKPDCMMNGEIEVLEKHKAMVSGISYRKRLAKVLYLSADRYCGVDNKLKALKMLISAIYRWPFHLTDILVVVLKLVLPNGLINDLRRNLDRNNSPLNKIYMFIYRKY